MSDKSKPMVYRVSANVTISCFTDVVARGGEEAAELARERAMQGLCHQCSGGDSKTEWSLSGELDGEPEVIDAEIIGPAVEKRATQRQSKAGEP